MLSVQVVRHTSLLSYIRHGIGPCLLTQAWIVFIQELAEYVCKKAVTAPEMKLENEASAGHKKGKLGKEQMPREKVQGSSDRGEL